MLSSFIIILETYNYFGRQYVILFYFSQLHEYLFAEKYSLNTQKIVLSLPK